MHAPHPAWAQEILVPVKNSRSLTYLAKLYSPCTSPGLTKMSKNWGTSIPILSYISPKLTRNFGPVHSERDRPLLGLNPLPTKKSGHFSCYFRLKPSKALVLNKCNYNGRKIYCMTFTNWFWCWCTNVTQNVYKHRHSNNIVSKLMTNKNCKIILFQKFELIYHGKTSNGLFLEKNIFSYWQ